MKRSPAPIRKERNSSFRDDRLYSDLSVRMIISVDNREGSQSFLLFYNFPGTETWADRHTEAASHCCVDWATWRACRHGWDSNRRLSAGSSSLLHGAGEDVLVWIGKAGIFPDPPGFGSLFFPDRTVIPVLL